MKRKILIILILSIIAIIFFIYLLYPNIHLKSLEKEVSNIMLPYNIEKITLKSAIGDSGGNGDYSTFRVVLVIKTEMKIEELKQEFEEMNLKFKKHYKNNNNKSIFYITNCKSKDFKSARDFSISFDELSKVQDYSNYYFIEFVE